MVVIGDLIKMMGLIGPTKVLVDVVFRGSNCFKLAVFHCTGISWHHLIDLLAPVYHDLNQYYCFRCTMISCIKLYTK